MTDPDPHTRQIPFKETPVFDLLIAVGLGLVFFMLHLSREPVLLAPWQVGVMAFGAFLMIAEPMKVASLRRVAPEAPQIDRVYYLFLLGTFWCALMLIGSLDEGWPEGRATLFTWVFGAMLFAIVMGWLDKGPSEKALPALRDRYDLSETETAGRWRRRWQILQMVAVPVVLVLAATWPRIWDAPAYPAFLLMLTAFFGPVVRHAAGLPMARLYRALPAIGIFAFVLPYALG